MEELKKVVSKDTVDRLIKSFFTENFDIEQAGIYFNVMHAHTNDFRVKHSNLTEYVYSHYDDVKSDEDGNTKEPYWLGNVEALKQYIEENESSFKAEDKKEILELPDKIKENIELAIIQYKHFFAELTNTYNELKQVNKGYEQTNDEFKKVTKDFKQASTKLDNSSSNFISMLGVFSALIFGVFGGFDAFKSIFSNINKASITMVIINSSILMIGLIILIFLLIQSISILSGKTFLACGCKNTSECSHEFYERYPLFSFSISLFLFILVLGLVYEIVYRAGVKTPYNFDLKQILFYIGVVFLIVVIGFLAFKIYKNNKKCNKDSLRKNEKSAG